MNILQVASLLIVLAGAFGAINYLFLRLPAAIGILIVALAASLGILGLDILLPNLGMADTVRAQVNSFEFSNALLEGMLGLLLFVGTGRVVGRGVLPPALPVGCAAVATLTLSWLLSRYALMPEGIRASLVFQAENALFWLVPLAHIGALGMLAVLARRVRPRGDGPAERDTRVTLGAFAIITPLAIAMYLQLYPRSDFMHQITAAPLSLIVGVALLDHVLGWWERGRWPSARAGRTLVRGTLLVAVGILVIATFKGHLPHKRVYTLARIDRIVRTQISAEGELVVRTRCSDDVRTNHRSDLDRG